MMSEKDFKKYRKSQLEGLREVLKNTMGFTCMCCQQNKPKREAAGAHLYETDDPMLQKAMIGPDGTPRVGTYVLCLECIDSLSEKVVHQRVTANFGKAGLFGEEKAKK